ncbi:MAG: FAD-dependent oxidoreductase [Patescibacteria group bacterium]
MKVGIIGGGLAGLTCSYRLSKKKIDSIIFEKEIFAGGNVLYNIGNITGVGLYKDTHQLIKELDLDVLLTQVPLTSFGIISGKKLVGGEAGLKMLTGLSKKEASYFKKITSFISSVNYFRKLNNYVNGLEFDVLKLSPEVKKLSNISFAEYIKGCPDMFMTSFVSPIMNFTFESDYTKVAADFALYTIRHGLETFSGKGYIFEENIIPLVNILEDKIKSYGNEVLTSSPVEKVKKTKKGFTVYYIKDGKQKSEIVDVVVFATPLPVTKSLLPELKIVNELNYKEIKCIMVKGELKYDRKIIAGIRETDVSNIGLLSTTLPYEHILIPFNPKKEVDFKRIYKKHHVIGEKIIKYGWPVRPPKAKVPDLKTNVDGAYICGNYYYFPLIETSIVTAQEVAKMIIKEESFY